MGNIETITFVLSKQIKHNTMKNFKVAHTQFGLETITHADGSKTYETACGRYITLERVEAVEIVDTFLTGNYVGYGYLPLLNKMLEVGSITQEEYQKIYWILD